MSSKTVLYSHFKSEYYFELCTSDASWDTELASSPQDNIFLRSGYLKISGLDEYKYFVKCDGNIVGGIILVTKENRSLLNYGTYQGLWLKVKNPLRYNDDLEMLEIIRNAAEIIEFNKIETNLSLHWSLTDVRGLDWGFFDSSDMSISFAPRYTGILTLENSLPLDQVFHRMRKDRVREFQRDYGISIHNNFNDSVLEEFLELYSETLHLKNDLQDRTILDRVADITTSSIQTNTGQLFTARDSHRRALAFVLLQDDGNVGYYQFGARSRNAAKIPANSKLLFVIIEELVQKNRRALDFVGMNSPLRGEYKASFNARPRLYFDVTIRTKSAN